LQTGEAAKIAAEDGACPSRPLLAALVCHGLRLADEADPLHRAAICSEVAEILAPNIVVLSMQGNAQETRDLGASMGDLVERGVASNLEQVEDAEPTEAQQEQAERIRRRTAQAAEVLEQNLAQAPPAARAGLQRAIEASGKGRDKALQPNKNKAKGKGVKNAPGPHKEPAPKSKSKGHQKAEMPRMGAHQIAAVDCPGVKVLQTVRLVCHAFAAGLQAEKQPEDVLVPLKRIGLWPSPANPV